MGCASSHLSIKDFKQEILMKNGGDYVNHIVSLTSSTYGALKLHNDQQYMKVTTTIKTEIYKKLPPCKEPDFINSWELMKDLEDEMPVNFKSPLKFLNQKYFPIKANMDSGFVERDNRGVENAFCSRLSKIEQESTNILREKNLCDDESLTISPKANLVCSKMDDDDDNDYAVSPMFDPMLIASYEKELYEGEEEQIKMIVSSQTISPKLIKSRKSDFLLHMFEKKCPPGGENGVVIYTTTLGGIRKTFEDCNNVRSIIESHQIQMFERDLSMDSGYREELRALMGNNSKDVKVPMVFVKGRLIGGVDEVMKLDDEGKLRVLFDGIPRVFGCCEMCGNVRFVMCMDCHGSCKIFDEDVQMNANCGECNENGLIQCPVCS